MKPRALLLQKSAALLVPFFLWTILSLVVGSALLPLPWTTVGDGIALLLAPLSWYHLALTAARALAGFSIAFFFGGLAGLFRGIFPAFELLTDPLVRFFQGVPPILWAIPVLFVAGFGFLTPVIVIILITLPLVTVTISEQMKTLPRENREMLSLFSPGPRAFLRELILPHVRPALASSLKLGLSLAVKAAIVGEFFSAGGGAGFMVNAAFQSAQIRRLYAWGFLIVCLIIGADLLIKAALRTLVFDREKQRKRDRLLLESLDIPTDPPAPRGKKRARSQAGSLALRNIDFSYAPATLTGDAGQNGPLFDNLSFKGGRNDLTVIYGDSGVGKTTLLKLAAGLLSPRRGRLSAGGGVRAFLFQEDRLLSHRTVLCNAALPLLYRGRPAVTAFKQTARLLARVGLAHALLSFPDELSGGMKRRLQLARCFAVTPSLVLLDEPFHGLHKKARTELWNEFISLWRESFCPAVFVTHYPEEIPRAPFLRFYELAGKPARLIAEKK